MKQKALLLAALALVFSSCSDKIIGYALVLWHDESLVVRPGETAPIISESEIQNTVTLERDDGTTVDIDTFRVDRYENAEAASQGREEFAPYANLFATALRTALPVRERPDRLSPRVYRLRDGEIMKIIRRQEEPSDEAGFVDYWYEVLTREGIRGWVFGYYLELADSGGRSLQPSEENDNVDRLLADIRSRVWRPAYFSEMIRTRRIDLSVFSPEFGFFAVPDEEAFRLAIPGYATTFEYLEYFSPREGTIEFENSSLILRADGDTDLNVQYNANGQESTVQLVDIDSTTDIEEIIQAERGRRASLIAEFLSRGNVLASTAYGSISLSDDGSFSWEGYDILVPDVLPSSFGGTGRLEFSVFLSDEMRSRYDGVFRLRLSSGGDIVFLYTMTDDGMRTSYVPSGLVRDNTISDEPLTPIVVFFRFVQS